VENSAQTLTQALQEIGTGRLVVVTGAGISLASGIPTFRGNDPDAVWKKDVTELGTRRYFEEDPVGSWQWYTSRFDVVLDKEPNAAHQSLTRIERWLTSRGGKFVLVTQNVDTLHEKASTQNLIKVHGSSDKVRCSRPGCDNAAPRGSILREDVAVDVFLNDPVFENLPKCPLCESILRQHVLWFDEYYDEHESYQWQRVINASETMDAVLFVGTSFAVGVTDLFLRSAMARHLPVWSIDPAEDRSPHAGVRSLAAQGEVLLPELVARLTGV